MKKIFSLFFSHRENRPHPVQNNETHELTVVPLPPVKTSNIESRDFIGLGEAMRLLGVSAPTLRKYATRGYYKRYTFGEKRTYYRRSELLNFLESSSATEQNREGND